MHNISILLIAVKTEYTQHAFTLKATWYRSKFYKRRFQLELFIQSREEHVIRNDEREKNKMESRHIGGWLEVR